jgi:Fic family protein
MSFVPRFSYNHELVRHLGVIEAARAVIEVLPLPPDTTLRLRHDALQRSTRSSTQIEGNPLDEAAVRRAIARSERTGGDAEQEVRNYWRALDRVEEFAETRTPITEAFIKELHRIVIVRGRGRRGGKSEYRITECPVVDTVTRAIDYGPPEPGDVPVLMRGLVDWLSSLEAAELPAPLRAGILTHRFLSIHPFNDGNGRTGRLLATAELWRSSYRMRGFFSFDEYFNADRDRYQLLTRLLARVLDGVENPFEIGVSDVASWFGISDKTAREWLQEWTEGSLIYPVFAGSGARVRSYVLAEQWIAACFKIRESFSENSGS